MNAKLSSVSTKGQIVIPARLRKRYSIRAGTKVAFIEQEHSFVVQPVTHEFISSLRGSLKGGPSLLALLRRERKRDRYL